MGAKEESATKELKEKAEMEESLLKVKSQQEEDESGAGRKSMQYGEALKKDRKVATHESIAEIARQRRSLPVFTVRDQLLQVIRDNQVSGILPTHSVSPHQLGSADTRAPALVPRCSFCYQLGLSDVIYVPAVVAKPIGIFKTAVFI